MLIQFIMRQYRKRIVSVYLIFCRKTKSFN